MQTNNAAKYNTVFAYKFSRMYLVILFCLVAAGTILQEPIHNSPVALQVARIIATTIRYRFQYQQTSNWGNNVPVMILKWVFNLRLIIPVASAPSRTAPNWIRGRLHVYVLASAPSRGGRHASPNYRRWCVGISMQFASEIAARRRGNAPQIVA